MKAAVTITLLVIAALSALEAISTGNDRIGRRSIIVSAISSATVAVVVIIGR